MLALSVCYTARSQCCQFKLFPYVNGIVAQIFTTEIDTTEENLFFHTTDALIKITKWPSKMLFLCGIYLCGEYLCNKASCPLNFNASVLDIGNSLN